MMIVYKCSTHDTEHSSHTNTQNFKQNNSTYEGDKKAIADFATMHYDN